MTTLNANIVIIGGGPAGAATAITAAQTLIEAGQDPSSIVLIEKREFDDGLYATGKVCGGFMMGDGLKTMYRDLSVDPRKLPHCPITHVHLSRAGASGAKLGKSRNQTILSKPGWGATFDRKQLDSALVARAIDLGVNVLSGFSARDVRQKEDGSFEVLIDGRSNGEKVEHSISTRMLVGAFGASPVMRSKFLSLIGREIKPEDDYSSFAFRYIADGPPPDLLPCTTRVSFMRYLDGTRENTGYVWDWPSPGPDGKVYANKGVGFSGISKALGPERRNDVLKFFPEDAQGLTAPHDGDIFRIKGAPLPMFHPRAGVPDVTLIRGGLIVLCGDAAGKINPLTGEGITEAMYDGLIGVSLAKAVLAGNFESVKKYSREKERSSIELFRRFSYEVLSEIYQDPIHYRNVLELLFTHPVSAHVLISFIERKMSIADLVDGNFIDAVKDVAKKDPDIVKAFIRVFGRFLRTNAATVLAVDRF